MKMSWFIIIFFLSYTISNLEANTLDQKKLPSTFVVGTVYCDTCFQENFSKSSHFISGASVDVECRDETSKPSFRQQVKTDEHGKFKISLPFSVSKHVKRIKRCSVKLIKSSEPNCAVASTATSSSLHLKSRKEGTHIFSAGFFTFKPLNQPDLCKQKPSQENSKQFNSKKVPSLPPIGNPTFPSFPPPSQAPTTPNLPPLPFLPRLPPLPQLPPLPPLPRLPDLPPMPGNTTQITKPEKLSRVAQLSVSDRKVSHPRTFFPMIPMPPNPFLPSPNCPPNPYQPPPACPQTPTCPPTPVQPPPITPPFAVPPPLSFPTTPSVPFTPPSPRMPRTPPASA